MNKNRTEAANYLKSYRKLCDNEKIIREQMFRIEQLLHSLNKKNPEESIACSGNSRCREFFANLLSEKEELRLRLLIVTSRKETIREMIRCLGTEEQIVLNRFFIKGDSRGAADELMEKLGYEKSQIYRIKDRALDRIYEWISEYDPFSFHPLLNKESDKKA